MQLYAITDRRLLSANVSDQRGALIELARRWAARGINYIQIREKDLSPDDLRNLTAEIAAAVRAENRTTRVLLNGPAEIALETGADGVHLPGDTPFSAAADARELFAQSGKDAIVSHACHSITDVLRVREESQRDPHATTTNTLILYAPVFEKRLGEDDANPLQGQGLDALRAAVHAAKNIPVFALGGVSSQNAPSCIAAGAAGIAGIRLFL